MSTDGKAFFWLFVLFLIQNGLNYIFLQNTPPLLLIGVVYYALTGGPFFGFIVGCYAGIFLELFAIGHLGYQMGVMGFIGGMTGFLSSRIFPDSLFSELTLPALANYSAALLNLLIAKSFFHEETGGLGAFAEAFSWTQLFITAVFSPLVFHWLKRTSLRAHGRLPVWR